MKTQYAFIITTFALTVLLCTGCEKKDTTQTSEIPVLTEGSWTAPNGGGQLIVENGIRILKLSGTNREMGYAHGYLLAKEIIYALNNFVVYTATDYGINYNDLSDVVDIMHWETRYLEELEGMLSGIYDRLGREERMIKLPDETREIILTDLKVSNAISDWSCSSFSVWGDARIDGSLLFARNLDYSLGHDEAVKKVHVIISYDDHIHNSWVTASICGFIGCITGMNAHGMALAIHDNNYYSSSDNQDFVPRCLILRKVAEHEGANWTPSDIELMMDTIKAYVGMNLHIAFPASGRTDDETAGVIEFDGNTDHTDGRATLRLPGDNSSVYYDDTYDQRLDYSNAIICTNHYLIRKDTPDFYCWESAGRIVTIKNNLESAKNDGHVSVEEAVAIMKMVGGSYTAHTVVFEPESKQLHFYLALPDQGGFDAPSSTYSYDDLF